MKTEASQEHLQDRIQDKTRPHFSLAKMQPIPPYKGPKRALVDLLDEVDLKVRHFRRECWNITIELIADHLELMTNPWKYSLPNVKYAGPVSKPNYPGFQELKKHIQKTGLIEAYVKAAKEEPGDHLGDIFVEEELAGRHNRLGQLLTPMQIVNAMIKMVGIGEKKQRPRPDAITEAWLSIESMAYNHKLDRNLRVEHQRLRRTFDVEPVWEKYVTKPETVLDPCVGSGRFLLGATWQEPKAPLVLFGIEIDLSLYRACLVNMALFSNHSYSIICANTLMIDPRYSGVGSKIWDMGNQWDPPDISMFYWKPTPPYKFSLADVIKTLKDQPVSTQPYTQSETPTVFSLAEFVRAKKQQET